MISRRWKYIAAMLAASVLAVGSGALFSAYRSATAATVSIDYIMDTIVEQKLYGEKREEAVAEISSQLKDFELSVSMHIEDSEIARLNRAAGQEAISVSESVYRLLLQSKELSLQSMGAFDLTIAPLTTVWGITSDHPSVPSEEDRESALAFVNAADLILENGTARLLHEGQAVDLGGIAKGAACDVVRAVAEQYGIDCGYVSIGGNLVVLEEKPLGRDFYFGVRDPNGTAAESICALTLYGKTMATTGAYERFFEENGQIYHHVLDPETGWPADSDLLSVTVICEDGALADFLSTTLFVLGKDTVLTCLERSDFEIIAVAEDGNVYCSSSLEAKLQQTENTNQYHFVYGEEE